MDRDKCQVCEKPILGGDDVVGKLETPFDSFHHWWHLGCFLRAERGRLMEAANVYNDRAVIRAFLRQEMKQPETSS